GFAVGATEGGVSDLAIAADGTVLVTTAGPGATSLHAFDIKAQSPEVRSVPSAGLITPGAHLYASVLSHQYVLVEEPNSATGTVHLYSSGADAITATTNTTSLGAHDVKIGAGAVDEMRGLVADVSHDHVRVLDLGLHAIADLSNNFQPGAVVGAAFSAFGDDLM